MVFTLRKGYLPLERAILPLERAILTLRRAILPPRRAILPLRKGYLPLRKGFWDPKPGEQPARAASSESWGATPPGFGRFACFKGQALACPSPLYPNPYGLFTTIWPYATSRATITPSTALARCLSVHRVQPALEDPPRRPLCTV